MKYWTWLKSTKTGLRSVRGREATKCTKLKLLLLLLLLVLVLSLFLLSFLSSSLQAIKNPGVTKAISKSMRSSGSKVEFFASSPPPPPTCHFVWPFLPTHLLSRRDQCPSPTDHRNYHQLAASVRRRHCNYLNPGHNMQNDYHEFANDTVFLRPLRVPNSSTDPPPQVTNITTAQTLFCSSSCFSSFLLPPSSSCTSAFSLLLLLLLLIAGRRGREKVSHRLVIIITIDHNHLRHQLNSQFLFSLSG